MPSIPTDFQLLDAIYERYYEAFANYSDDTPSRGAKIYVPIDIKELAAKFNVDPDIIFGRLYYHLEKTYTYKDAQGASIPFFALRVGGDAHCVNFPYLASVLANMRTEHRKNQMTTVIAVVGFLFSIYNFVIALRR